MQIILESRYQTAFFAAAARTAHQPLVVQKNGAILTVDRLTTHEIALLLAYSVFPHWEHHVLEGLARRKLTCFTNEQQQEAVLLALDLLEDDVRRDDPASGPRRREKIAQMMEYHLCRFGRLDLREFFRFTLPGHAAYLQSILDLAADNILAKEEDERCFLLLSHLSAPGRCHLDLCVFFSPDEVCHIWELTAQGMRLSEGGCIRGMEDLFCANLIAARPQTVTLRGIEYAPPMVITLLTNIFGTRLHYEENTETLDNEYSRMI